MILTLTTNPALDVSTDAAAVVPTAKLRCAGPRVQVGGGGIDVARVLSRFGVEPAAAFAAGGPAGRSARPSRRGDLVDAAALVTAVVLTFHTDSAGRRTRIASART